MFENLLYTFQNTDFSGTKGLLLLIAMLIPVFAALFLSVYQIILRRSAWGRYKRRLKRILWSKKPTRKKIPRRRRYLNARFGWSLPAAVLLYCYVVFAPISDIYFTSSGEEGSISCYRPYITDGDTLKCNGTRIRLYSIDAPEMKGHCREGRKCVDGDPYASKDYLISLTRGIVTCTPIKKDHYGRTVANCKSGQSEDLSCSMVKAGHAIERYGNLRCSI